MFEKSDISTYFRCQVVGDIVCPPDLNHIEQMIYSAKVMNRKGGYGPLLKRMVIAASLMKGKFDDSILFAGQ